MKREVVNLLSTDNKQIDEAEEKHVHLGSDNPDVQIEYQRAVIEKLKEEIQGLKQDREQRKVFSYSIFGFMCVYMTIAMVIVFLSGLGVMSLSDNVLITLLTTTLADVIGVKYDVQAFFKEFSFLNATEIARRAGINPSLMRQYVSGVKTAGEKTYQRLNTCMSNIKADLQATVF